VTADTVVLAQVKDSQLPCFVKMDPFRNNIFILHCVGPAQPTLEVKIQNPGVAPVIMDFGPFQVAALEFEGFKPVEPDTPPLPDSGGGEAERLYNSLCLRCHNSLEKPLYFKNFGNY